MRENDFIPNLEKPESDIGFDPNIGTESVEVPRSAKNKMTAGILAILFGAWGFHKFYLGYYKTGIFMAIFTVCMIPLNFIYLPALVAVAEGVRYLTLDKERFYLQYVANKKYWF